MGPLRTVTALFTDLAGSTGLEARIGPARAQATFVSGNLWRIDVRDVGNDNRVCGTSFARVS